MKTNEWISHHETEFEQETNVLICLQIQGSIEMHTLTILVELIAQKVLLAHNILFSFHQEI